jgi:2-isopropylmalate synthase
MPYLPLDPKDLGRSYEAVIRVNSQSGKGGISYLLESEYGLELPRRLQIEFSQVVQTVMDATGKELTAQDLFELFEREYGVRSIPAPQHQVIEEAQGTTGKLVRLQAEVEVAGRQFSIQGAGNGPIDAFVEALGAASGENIRVLDYHEHAIGSGANAQAVAYLELRVGERTLFGVGMDSNIVSASLKAIVSGLQRAQAQSKEKQGTWQPTN